MPARLRTFVLVLLVFSPALFTLNLVRENAVDVAAWDEWETAPLLAKWHDGTLAWSDLYAAQIQHRMVVPRLLTIAMANLSGGDFRWNVYACAALVLLDAVLLWMLVQRTMPGSPWRWPLMFAFNLLLFCPMHYETLLWGSSMWGNVTMPCLLAALLVLTAQPRAPLDSFTARQSWTRFLIALLLAETATHSFAHGLAAWPVLLLVLIVNPALGPLHTRLIQGGVWCVTAALTVWAYFTDFINVAFHAYNLKPGDHALKGSSNLFEGDHVARAVDFVFGLFGSWFARSPFVDHPLERAMTLGLTTLVLFGAVAGFAILSRRMRGQWAALLPWLGLGAYTLTVGLMLSKRAADTGVHRALMTRYLVLSQYLLVSGLALGALTCTTILACVWMWWRKRSAPASADSSLPPHLLPVTGAVLFTAFCVAQIPCWEYGLHLTEAAHRGRRHAQALMLLLPHLQQQKKLISMKPLCKSFDYCLNAVNELQRIGLMRTPPLATPELKSFRREDKPLIVERADVTGARFLDDGTVELGGYARFGAEAPADLILIAQSGRIIGIGQPTPRHLLRIYGLDFDMTNLDDVPYGTMFPWRGRISPALIPDPTQPLELWALDVKDRRIAKIVKEITLDAAAKQVTVK